MYMYSVYRTGQAQAKCSSAFPVAAVRVHTANLYADSLQSKERNLDIKIREWAELMPFSSRLNSIYLFPYIGMMCLKNYGHIDVSIQK